MSEKSRSPRPTVDPVLPQKKRARRRLIGALVLALPVLLWLPRLFETPAAEHAPELVLRRDGATAPAGSAAAGEAARDATADAAPAEAQDPPPDNVVPDASPAAPGASIPPARTEPPVAMPVPAVPARDATAIRPEPSKPESARPATARPEAAASEPRKPEVAKPEPPKAEPRRPETPVADAPRAETPRPEAARGAFVLQVGAFRSEEAATRAMDAVRAAGLPVFTERSTVNGMPVTRVRAGPFRDRDAVQRAREQLASRGVEAAIIAP